MPSRSMIVITGIICITLLEGMAIHRGLDGWYFTFVLMVIAAAMGIEVKTIFDKVRSGNNGKASNPQSDNRRNRRGKGTRGHKEDKGKSV